jgi:hypothetical protein
MFEPFKAGTPVNLTSSGAITAGANGSMLGFYVNSTNAGTLVIKDGGSGGTARTGTITPAVGWHFLPLMGVSSSGLYATIAGTALDVTFIVLPQA